MTIKFVPSSQGVKLLDREMHDKAVLDLLKCAINGLKRVELQLEKLTEEEIDADDGDKL